MVDSGAGGRRVSQSAAGGGAGGDTSGSRNSVGGADAQGGSSAGQAGWPGTVDAGAGAARDAAAERVLPIEATVVDAASQADVDAPDDQQAVLIAACSDMCAKQHNLDCNPFRNDMITCQAACRGVWEYVWDECHDIVPATLKCRLAAPDSYSYSCSGNEVTNLDTVCAAQAKALSECVDTL